MFSDDIWDEERWESFLRKDDERVSRYMKILNRFLDEHPPPKSDDREVQLEWREAFRAYLIQYGWQSDDVELTFFRSEANESPEEEAVEDTLEFIEAHTESVFEELSFVPVYRDALSLTQQTLDWSDQLPGAIKDSTLVQFCANIMQITANIAKGHGMGLERDMIGGNIACLKRAIKSANSALELLPEMKDQAYMDPAQYLKLYEDVYELRNSIGIYIQELRDRFIRGID
ncbi:MAG: four helix bundle protein [Rhodothermaceae bacterium]|nr:four helix bundle protein [Rhodothermaceae bacterium]